jgi:hypothetical protein
MSYIEDSIKEFCTPSWAATIIYGRIKDFTDLELQTIKIFVDDQLKARESKVAA